MLSSCVSFWKQYCEYFKNPKIELEHGRDVGGPAIALSSELGAWNVWHVEKLGNRSISERETSLTTAIVHWSSPNRSEYIEYRKDSGDSGERSGIAPCISSPVISGLCQRRSAGNRSPNDLNPFTSLCRTAPVLYYLTMRRPVAHQSMSSVLENSQTCASLPSHARTFACSAFGEPRSMHTSRRGW